MQTIKKVYMHHIFKLSHNMSEVSMERYFVGNNTGHGFYSNYEKELDTMNQVILLKGGPGTGKSSILKRLYSLSKTKGYDCELWYCSGDPQSLDGVYIKDIKVAVVDATAPHAIGADLPIIKDVIFDLATSLDKDKLMAYKEDIKLLVNDKKQCFMRAYQYLKCALCHLTTQLELENNLVNMTQIKEIARTFVDELSTKTSIKNRTRKLFSRAICPSGENEYFDHLKGKKITIVDGLQRAKNIFFDEIASFGIGDIYLLNPLEPDIIEGIVAGDRCIVSSKSHLDKSKCDIIKLPFIENEKILQFAQDEKNNITLQIAFAVEYLNMARENHLKIEKYFVSAMDFASNEKIYNCIVSEIFT